MAESDAGALSKKDAPAPVPARDAATIMLVRDGDDGLEVCMLRRHLDSDFVGGAFVFPGGKVDLDDRSARARTVTPAPGFQSRAPTSTLTSSGVPSSYLGEKSPWTPGRSPPARPAPVGRP